MAKKDKDRFLAAISTEKNHFLEQLPELLKTIPGKWVLFKDGKMLTSGDTLDDVIRFGLDRFGLDTPFLVERVEEQKPMIRSFSYDLGLMYVS